MLITMAMDRTAGLASLYLSMRGQGRCCELIETSKRPKKWCLVIVYLNLWTMGPPSVSVRGVLLYGGDA